jgi:DNA-directed RNA polymerase sigma subunit (sigma70/sigma32)
MAWQGVTHLDAPAPSGDGATLADMLADTLGMPAELIEASDMNQERRRAIRDAVHATLARMGRQQAFTLRATYGISPVPHMERDAEIAEALGVAESRITVIRCKGKERFRELYLAGALAVAELAFAA